MKDPNDLETIRNTLLCDSIEDCVICLDESNTDEDEHISEVEDDSESELIAASNSEDEDYDDRSTVVYIIHLKKNRNIIDSWKWQKKSIQEN
ncbi:hypothetical protein NPIL_426731 [Nephila pilipes]|uniref:Uncharacterized protein n=1 Tax=Nephila pilipes TaxID=299642 RepID=A0A8X6QA12_NEPPI|nr:hypothetical protein NPIL_426731 [Nephila pilipes]